MTLCSTISTPLGDCVSVSTSPPRPHSMAVDVASCSCFSALVAPLSTHHAARLRRSLSCMQFSSCKWPAVPCCSISGGGASSPSSTSSYSRRWFNPLRRRPLDTSPVEIFRRWVEADQPPPSHPQDKFTVVSYNILGDKNALKHKDMYDNVPSNYMKWERRKQVISEELISLSPDIICLQEVDKYLDLSNIMQRGGYVGSYKRRTGDIVDGCAVFWRDSRFQLLEEETIEFKDFGLRDNVAQLCVFEMCKDESKRIVVGNIHVLYYPSKGDIKLGQIRLLSSKADILSKKWGGIPVLLMGDFNSTPQSPIYEFLSKSQLDIMSLDRRELSGQRSCHPSQVFGGNRNSTSPMISIDRLFSSGWTEEEMKTVGASTGSRLVSHPLKLNSSYAAVKGSSRVRDPIGEPLATSYHSKFFGTVDYIWFSDGLVPTRVLDTAPVDSLRRTGGLPCKNVGSDHLALVAEFAFADKEETSIDDSESSTAPMVS